MELIKILFFPFKAIPLLLAFLFRKELLSRNTGLLLDGESLKLAERESFQNVCVVARVGAGKTSRYIIPNVLERAKSPCSVVVNDPKGEVYEATSGYMRANGFRIIVIDPENLDRSNTFNPLTEAKNDIELDQIAEILIKAGKQGGNQSSGNGDFWSSGVGLNKRYQSFIGIF
jgi:type IV secretory pathway TraG/TraD family ATPase VirD4